MKTTRILIADDHDIVRAGVWLIEKEADGKCDRMQQLIDLYLTLRNSPRSHPEV